MVASVTGVAALEVLEVVGVEIAIAGGLEEAVDGVDAAALMTSWPEVGALCRVLGTAAGRADGAWIVGGRRLLDAGDAPRDLGIGLGPR